MIQPVSQTISKYPVFKNSNDKKYNPFGKKAAESIDNTLDYQRKIVEQNERNIGIFGITSVVVTAAVFLFSLKTSLELSNILKHKIPAFIRNFESLVNDSKIPTIENCKSINKDLKSILERQMRLTNAGKDIISETGEPQASNRLLLYGPAGVGKSFFAKIFAKSIGAEYMEVRFSDFNSMWAGEGVSNLRRIFDNVIEIAKKNPQRKYVVTFNEIDAIVTPADKLSENSKGTHWVSKMEERTVFLDYLLELKDKVPNVTVIGTTNISPENNKLDKAAMSRFQNIVEVPYPEKDCLFEALKMNLDKIKDKDKFFADNEKELKTFAEQMAKRKFSFRNLEYIVNDAKTSHLDDKLKGKNNDFSLEYLKQAEQKLKFSDGELESKNIK